MQGAGNGQRPGQSGDVIGDRQTDALRPLVGRAGHAHQPRHPLDDMVVGGSAGERPLGPVAGQRAIDDVGLHGPDVLVTAAQPVHRPWAVVFHDHVRLLGQAQKRLAPARRLQVHEDAGLACVLGRERSAHSGGPQVVRAPMAAHEIVAADAFDAGRLRTHETELIGGVGTGEDMAGVQHAHAVERQTGHIRLRRSRWRGRRRRSGHHVHPADVRRSSGR